MAFRGTFDHTLDAKNRLTIPAKFRAALSEGVVLSKGSGYRAGDTVALEQQIKQALATATSK